MVPVVEILQLGFVHIRHPFVLHEDQSEGSFVVLLDDRSTHIMSPRVLVVAEPLQTEVVDKSLF